MRILIVDDQYDEKVRAISTAIGKKSDVVVDHVAFTDDAITKIQSSSYDILIIDLQLAETFGKPINPDAGRSLLEFILHDPLSKLPSMIVGVTSHKNAYNDSFEFFNRHGYSLHLYNGEADFIREIIEKNYDKYKLLPTDVDVLIVNALESNELKAVLDLCDEAAKFFIGNDPTPYYKLRIKISDTKYLTGVALALPSMGMVSASAITMKACILFKPKLIAMTGICAAANAKLNLGDIVVAKISWDWGSGKLSVNEDKQPLFYQAPDQISVEPALSSYFESIAVNRTHLNKIYDDFRGKKPTTILNLHVGPMCSGSVVLEDPSVVRRIVENGHRKTLAIDMEAYGVMFAVRMWAERQTPCVVIKSVVDYANPEKSDDWQDYASYTSAAILFKYLKDTCQKICS